MDERRTHPQPAVQRGASRMGPLDGRAGRLCLCLGLWIVLRALLPLPAQAQPAVAAPQPALVLAFFTPYLDFTSPLERSGWSSSVAQHLSAALGQPVDAKGFARSADFKAFLDRQKVALAVVDAQLGLSFGWQPLLQAVGEGGQAAPPMALVSRAFRTIPELKGKTLILASNGGGEKTLVQALALAWEVAPAKFFGKVVLAPDAPSAAAAVSLGKADASLLYLSTARSRGLEPLHAPEGVPLPLLMDPGKKLPADLKERVLAAMAGVPGGGGVSGWRLADAGLLQRFTGRLSGREVRLLVPASLPWLPLRDPSGRESPVEGDQLPLDPLPAADLLQGTPIESRFDYLPRGQLQEGAAP